MRTTAWLIALVLNGAAVVLLAPVLYEVRAPAQGRVVGGGIAALLLAAVVLLVLARVGRLPSWGPRVMRYVCVSIPVLWAVGSLDHGILSGLEFLSVAITSVFAWGTWLAFKLFPQRL